MTFQSRAVLRQLRKLSEGTEIQLRISSDDLCILQTDDSSKFYDYSEFQDEIFGIIDDLEKEGYIKHTLAYFHFRLTSRGLHPHQYTYQQVMNFLIKSVFVPVAVSVVTTLITLAITAWLQSL